MLKYKEITAPVPRTVRVDENGLKCSTMCRYLIGSPPICTLFGSKLVESQEGSAYRCDKCLEYFKSK